MNLKIGDTMTVSLLKLVFAFVAAVCVGGLIHTYPDADWIDEAWGAGALGAALLSFILP